MNKLPLFSVIVITYNSAKYILDTLESIKQQHYQHLELIISDDRSTDNTVEICKNCLAENSHRFVNSSILVPEQNQGIPANCNQGLKVAQGDWIKVIAGDDAFFDDAFENAAQFVVKNPNVKAFCSSVVYYQDNFAPDNEVSRRNDQSLSFYEANAKRQHFLLIRNNYIHAASVFLQRELILELGGFMEEYKMLEDHPMWLKITENGEKFYYLPAYTVKYRLHSASIFSHQNAESIFNNFYLKKRSFELEMIYPHLRWYEKLSYQHNFMVKRFFDGAKLNQQKTINQFLYQFLMALSPVALIHLLKKSNKR